MYNPNACRCGRGGCRFPRCRDVGEEAVPLRFGLVEDLITPVAVPPDGRSRCQNQRLPLQTGKRGRQEACADDPAVEDLLLVGLGPPAVANPGPGEVEDGICALESGGVDRATTWVPFDLVRALRRTPHESHDLVTLGSKSLVERSADEAAGSADDNFHDSALCSACDALAEGAHPSPPFSERSDGVDAVASPILGSEAPRYRLGSRMQRCCPRSCAAIG